MAPKASPKKGNEGADRVHVVVRIRPPVRKDEKFGEGSEALQVDREKNMIFLLAENEERSLNPKQFAFDRVLWKDAVQSDAWEAAGVSVTKAVMEGYTGCVMCYGQTGAGKTYTLANDKPGQEGVMIQAFNFIFASADNERELKYEVQLSYQQIYLDGISDLLQPSAPVELREDPKEGVYVSGARWETVTSTALAMAALNRGNSNRATASTKMNADSSRSHAVLTLSVKCTGGVRTLNGKLYLVDLAGSERVKKSGVEGAGFDEAKAINQSLTTLGRCIEVLASNKKEKAHGMGGSNPATAHCSHEHRRPLTAPAPMHTCSRALLPCIILRTHMHIAPGFGPHAWAAAVPRVQADQTALQRHRRWRQDDTRGVRRAHHD